MVRLPKSALLWLLTILLFDAQASEPATCKTKAAKEQILEAAKAETKRIVSEVGPHKFDVVKTQDGWIVHVQIVPMGVSRHKTIFLNDCGRVLKVEGGR